MIDTLNIRYDINDFNKVDEIAEWLKINYAETYEERTKIDGSRRYTCKIKNLTLSIDSMYLYINGSIQKFYTGDNVNAMTNSDLYKAINLLNESLGYLIDIKNGYVRRIDLGVNLIMDKQPSFYITKLHSSSQKKPTYYSDQTISLGNKSRGMIIYNKTVEANKENKKLKRDINIPSNLLRLEAYIKGRKVFEKHFGKQLPTVNNLLAQVNKLPDIWLDEYRRIDKEYSVSVDQIKSQKDLLRYTIISTGYTQCEQIINTSYDMHIISKQDRYRLHNTVKEAFSQINYMPCSDPIAELDEKVNDFYNKVLA